MSFSYTPGASPRDQVRQMVPDTDSTNVIFQDAEVDAQLVMEAALQPNAQQTIESVFLATADLLEIIATSEVLVQKVMKALDVATDGAKQSAALRARAEGLRDRVFAGDGSFDWAEQVDNSWTENERVIDQAQRNAI